MTKKEYIEEIIKISEYINIIEINSINMKKNIQDSIIKPSKDTCFYQYVIDTKTRCHNLFQDTYICLTDFYKKWLHPHDKKILNNYKLKKLKNELNFLKKEKEIYDDFFKKLLYINSNFIIYN